MPRSAVQFRKWQLISKGYWWCCTAHQAASKHTTTLTICTRPSLRKHSPEAPPRPRQQTSNYSLLLIYRPRKDERLSWPVSLTGRGWFTHISGHPSTAGRVQDREVRWRKTGALPLCHTNNRYKLNRQKWHRSVPNVSTQRRTESISWSRLDSLHWFSQRRSPTPHLWGAHPRGYDPKFELGQDFCTMHLPPNFHHPMFTRLEVNVLTNTNRQTNRRRWKHPTLFSMLRRWVMISAQILKNILRTWKSNKHKNHRQLVNAKTSFILTFIEKWQTAHNCDLRRNEYSAWLDTMSYVIEWSSC